MEIKDIQVKIEKLKKKALEEFASYNDIEELIETKFNNAIDKLVMDVLGMEKGWDGYKVKSWDGHRGKDLPIFQYITSDEGKTKTKAMIAQLFKEFEFKLTERETKSIHAAFRREYMEYLRDEIDDFAKQKAKEDAKKMIDEIIGKG